MNYDLIGRPQPRSQDRDPEDDLVEKRISCARCGEEYPASELTTIPPGDEPGRPRIYVCRSCR